MEWERTTYFAVLFPHCSSDVCFLCFVVCFGHHVVLCFVCRCVCPAERWSSLSGWVFLSSVSAILVFFLFFVWKYFISVFLRFPCLSPFFFSFHCFSCLLVLSICLDGSSLSFRFFSCFLYSNFIYSFFFSIVYLYINIDFWILFVFSQ